MQGGGDTEKRRAMMERRTQWRLWTARPLGGDREGAVPGGGVTRTAVGTFHWMSPWRSRIPLVSGDWNLIRLTIFFVMMIPLVSGDWTLIRLTIFFAMMIPSVSGDWTLIRLTIFFVMMILLVSGDWTFRVA